MTDETLHLSLDAGCWTTRLDIPAWSAFRNTYVHYPNDDGDTRITVTYAPEGRDEAPLTAAEQNVIRSVLADQPRLSKVIVARLFASYSRLQMDLAEAWDCSPEERAEVMPDLTSADQLEQMIELYSIFIHPLTANGAPYVGFQFGCSWDGEHGLGVLMNGERIVELGQADCAFTLWMAEQDANSAPPT